MNVVRKSSGQVLLWVLAVGAIVLIGGLSQVSGIFTRNRMQSRKDATLSRLEMRDSIEQTLLDVATQIAFSLSSGTLSCSQVSTDLVGRWPKSFRTLTWSLWNGQGVSSTDLRHRDAFARCSSGQRLAPSDNYSSLDTIYFCLRLSGNSTTERAVAMLSESPVVVEASIALKDIFAGTLSSCSGFRSIPLGKRGATLSFATYWSKRVGKNREYFTYIDQQDFLTN